MDPYNNGANIVFVMSYKAFRAFFCSVFIPFAGSGIYDADRDIKIRYAAGTLGYLRADFAHGD